jgi:TRAP-type C4-dicarboxylate transport system permease large subunit
MGTFRLPPRLGVILLEKFNKYTKEFIFFYLVQVSFQYFVCFFPQLELTCQTTFEKWFIPIVPSLLLVLTMAIVDAWKAKRKKNQ